MDELDKDLQKRVWERVQNREMPSMPPLVRENIRPWMMAAQENTAVYQHLARKMTGRAAEQLRRLEQESGKSVACMKGLCRLQGENVKLPPLPVGKDPARRALEKCYHRERRLWEDAQRRSAEPEHGPVFRQLARRAEDHCTTLAEILGRME